jgi:MOSC domain-containing protein YiiM
VPTVVSIQVGPVRAYAGFRSAIAKEPVQGPLALRRLGLEGDAQADRRFHGGPDRALLAYSLDHYPGWRLELELPGLLPGAFGENLTVAGLSEDEACIGDAWALGEAQLEVSQPRVPCVKLSRRLGRADAAERALASGRSGIYLRVLREGQVAPGPLALLSRPHPGLTVALALAALRDPAGSSDALDRLRSCPQLAEAYRSSLDRRSKRR